MAVRKFFDRYSEFRFNGKVKILPFLRIPSKATDIFVTYKADSRLDIISQDIYNNPNFGWLILQANPQYGGLEFDIPTGTPIRVPFPLEQSLNDYDRAVLRYKKFYGI